MKRVLKTCSVLLLLCSATAHAQLYKWVGPDGKVTYSDTPPPKSASKVETKSLTGGGISVADLPFEVAQATKNHPVTLYTTRDCTPCNDGRKMLSERGIPFSEKTVNSAEDIEHFRKIHDGSLPVLMVGRVKERGFEANAWNSALTAAGYPTSNTLPKTYRNPQAEAAAPKPVESKKESFQSAESVSARPAAPAVALPPATGNAPPGFRF